MAKNPFFKMGEVVNALFGEDELTANFEEAQEEYENTKQGAPENGLDYIIASLPGVCTSYIANIVTPGFVRDISQGYDLAKSYKRAYKTNAVGEVVTDAYGKGVTEKVDF